MRTSIRLVIPLAVAAAITGCIADPAQPQQPQQPTEPTNNEVVHAETTPDPIEPTEPVEGAVPLPVLPDDLTGDPEQLAAMAVTSFQAKDYGRSIALFLRAHDIDAQPNNLFNIARVYEEAGDIDSAIAYLRRFIAEPGVDFDSRQVATERLEVLIGVQAQLNGG